MRCLFLLLSLGFFGACQNSERKDIPLSCSLQLEPGMNLSAFQTELKRIRMLGFREIRLDAPLVRGVSGLPEADSLILSLLPEAVNLSKSTFDHWSFCITRLHPDSIADSTTLRNLGTDSWCTAYQQSAEKYLAVLPASPKHLVAGWSLPNADTLPCLRKWMLELHTRFTSVTWLVPATSLPHPIQETCSETGVLWEISGEEPSKAFARKLNPYIVQNNPGKKVYVGGFYPRPSHASEDFLNVRRFWPEGSSISGITFASVFPVSTLTDSLKPGTLAYESELKKEIADYLHQP